MNVKMVFVVASMLRKDHVGAYGNPWLSCENLSRLGGRSTVYGAAATGSADPRTVRLEWLTGLCRRRFRDTEAALAAIDPQITLFSLLRKHGCVVGVLTDRPDMVAFYRRLGEVDFLLTIPGQADDPAITSAADVSCPFENHYRPIVASAGPDAGQLRRYVRNVNAGGGSGIVCGDRSVMLFAEARRALVELAGHERVFLWVDSFAMGWPWNASEAFCKYRPEDQLHRLAWLAKPSISADEVDGEGLRFFRCAYADSCLAWDAAIGPIVDLPEDVGAKVIVASDHGVAIGDEGIIGVPTGPRPVGTSPSAAVGQQVLMIASPGGTPGRCDEPVRPVDLYAGVLAMAGVHLPFATDGDGKVLCGGK